MAAGAQLWNSWGQLRAGSGRYPEMTYTCERQHNLSLQSLMPALVILHQDEEVMADLAAIWCGL